MTVRASAVTRLGVGIVTAAILVVRSLGAGVGAQTATAPAVGSDTRGLRLTAEVVLGALPPGSMYWHIHEFDSRATAEAARPARGVVAEAFGRHWLYVIAEETWRTDSGRKVAIVGPFILSPDTSYTARYMRALYPRLAVNARGPYGPGHRGTVHSRLHHCLSCASFSLSV